MMNTRGQYGHSAISRSTLGPRCYGPMFSSPWAGVPEWPYHGPPAYVGEGGSIFGHSPGDAENELDQLHGEIMCFGQELIELKNALGSSAGVQRERDEELAAWKIVESFHPLANEVERIEKLLNTAGVDKTTTTRWRLDSVPPYADIMATGMTGLKQQFIAALNAIDKFMPKAQRQAAVARARDLSQKRQDAEYKVQGANPLIQWDRSTWTPFFASWSKFRSEKKDIPFQSWQLSGTWDRIQDYRTQFIDLVNHAPFKSKCPKPIDPRKDPSITSGVEQLLTIGKYALIGVLGIGAVVAIASVATSVRTGRDPIEPYKQLYQGRRRQ